MNNQMANPDVKLFMLLLGSRPPGRHVEQHDFFFGIATSLKDLVPEIKAFWREAKGKIHVDGWREVTVVDGYRIRVLRKPAENVIVSDNRLFFINLGGYRENRFEEQHYTVLTVKKDRAAAFREAKDTVFFKHNHFKGAGSHIDDKYGIDVDDLYDIDEMLTDSQKDAFVIEITPENDLKEDVLHLGYFKLDRL